MTDELQEQQAPEAEIFEETQTDEIDGEPTGEAQGQTEEPSEGEGSSDEGGEIPAEGGEEAE
jgi:hypothetical protein